MRGGGGMQWPHATMGRIVVGIVLAGKRTLANLAQWVRVLQWDSGMSQLINRLPLFALLLALACTGCHRQPSTDGKDWLAHKPAAAPLGPVRNAFPTAATVRLFVETGYSAGGDPIYSKPSGVSLTQRQRAQFEAALVVQPMPDEDAACFIPHHFFRYYDKSGKPLGDVAVCFCCGGVRASGSSNIVTGPNQELSANFGQVAQLIESMGEPINVLCE